MNRDPRDEDKGKPGTNPDPNRRDKPQEVDPQRESTKGQQRPDQTKEREESSNPVGAK
jgi:hypothetical protein